MKRILIVFGTRPEAIKMAPVVSILKNHRHIETRVCVTAQHREMLDQVLSLFEIVPDYDLDLMISGQTLSGISSKILQSITDVVTQWRPDLVLVHGDTTTTAMTATACFYQRIPVGHVEAGLRTGNIWSPWPEEFNRRLASMVTQLHFAPTEQARLNLIAENVSAELIEVTGNTVIDALLHVSGRIDRDQNLKNKLSKKFSFLDDRKRILLVTGHRRENFGDGMQSICRSLLALAIRNDLEIVYPVHRNPNVAGPVEVNLAGKLNIHLLAPQDYVSFVYLMKRCTLLLTDSGGIQEEAPSLGKPVLVMRETTERPEGVNAGTVRLVGTDTTCIEREVSNLLDDSQAYLRMSTSKNPYGDGTASLKICRSIECYFAST
jgi:UDP-N-acetylglucosamine 2-epimerase